MRKKAGVMASGAGRVLLAAALLVLGSWSISAADLSVTYVEGQAEIRKGSAWSELSIGDNVAQDTTLRMAAGSYLELSSSGTNISLYQPGTYVVRDLLASASKVRTGKTLKALSGSLARLAGGREQHQSAVMGVRGAQQGEPEQMEWVASDAQAFLDEGKGLIKSGDFAGAIEQLKLALDAAVPEELPEVRYYLANAYSLNGNTRDSIKQISGLNPAGGEPWAQDFFLLKASLLIETNAFRQEVELLTGKGAELAQDAQRAQAYYFLLAVGYRGLADTASEKKTLEKAISIAPDSDIGKAATELAASL